MEGSNTASVSAPFLFYEKDFLELLAKVGSKFGVIEEGFSYALTRIKNQLAIRDSDSRQAL